MVRGRATGRGTRRGAAAAGQRPQPESSGGDSNTNRSASQDVASTAAPTAVMSSADQSGASASTAPSRGSAATRTTRGVATGRFRPKNVRRDEAERDVLARKEQQKASERAAEERRAQGRSRFRSKRSRGDAMGSRGGFGRVVSAASGPFSSGLAGSNSRIGGGWFGGGGGGGGGGGPGGFARVSKFDTGSGGIRDAGSGGFREARINADKLHVQTPENDLDSDDEAMIAALNTRAGSMMPMGIYRKAHKETGIIVATTAELEAAENANVVGGGEEESLWVDDDGARPLPGADQPEEQGIWDADSKKPVIIKNEPTDENTMDIDVEVKSPEQEKKRGKALAAEAKSKKALPQDTEERMIQTDLQLLASELGTISIASKAEEGEEGESKPEGPSNKDGRLYLFQFPPLLPPLKQTAMPKTSLKVKEEESQQVSMLDALADPTPVDLTQEESAAASGAEVEDEEEEEAEAAEGFRGQMLSHGGVVGRLNVRRSGKVELDWGGCILELSPAAGMNFLTTAVMLEESDEKPQQNGGVTGGESIGMGKIMGRFVLAPVWSEEEEWNVSPEELAF